MQQVDTAVKHATEELDSARASGANIAEAERNLDEAKAKQKQLLRISTHQQLHNNRDQSFFDWVLKICSYYSLAFFFTIAVVLKPLNGTS